MISTNITEASKKDWDDFWNSVVEDLSLERVWDEMEKIESLTPKGEN
jgi:hypothetical protein